MADKLTDKYNILVSDPEGSSTQTPSGATCKMTKPGFVQVDPDASQASLRAGGGHFISAAKDTATFTTARNTNTVVDGDNDKSATVNDGVVKNAISEYNPFTRLFQNPNNPFQPSKAQAIHADVAAKAGIACTKEGKPVAPPVLSPRDLVDMAKKSRIHFVTPKLPSP